MELSTRQLPRLVWCAFFCLVSTAAAQSIRPDDYPFEVKPYSELVKLFDYRRDIPINAKLDALLSRAGIRLSEIQYDDPLGGDRISGYLVQNDRKSPQPAVVFIHSGGGRDAFLPEAIFLARLGAVTMSIAPPKRDDYPEQVRDTIIVLRRAFDYLASRPDVDSRRICLVGHSAGAMQSAVVAGIDERFNCFVFEGGELGMTFYYRGTIRPEEKRNRENGPADEMMKALATIAPYDAIHYVGHIKASTLFQAGRLDLGVSEADSNYFYEATTGPKQIKWYDTAHDMSYNPAVLKDRAEFLRKQLGIDPPMPLICAELALGRACKK
jgi:dipeptidyl aminopeptidase/acylaminoacyl peptidase